MILRLAKYWKFLLEHKFSDVQAQILVCLYLTSARTIEQISDETGINRESLRRFTRILRKDELLERRTDPDDLRIVTFNLTVKSRELMDELRDQLELAA